MYFKKPSSINKIKLVLLQEKRYLHTDLEQLNIIINRFIYIITKKSYFKNIDYINFKTYKNFQ